jgi:hypothetical protein
MILGMSVGAFTAVHVILSLVAIGAGLLVLAQMLQHRRPGLLTSVFLLTTVLTSITGFPIPPLGLDPPRIVGLLSLLLLAVAILGLYVFKLRGPWRSIYVVTAVAALYLNCFVAVAQTFMKVAFFNALAPTQAEPPFAISQAVVLTIFVSLAVLALRRFPAGGTSA